jgi:hypothetical protein
VIGVDMTPMENAGDLAGEHDQQGSEDQQLRANRPHDIPFGSTVLSPVILAYRLYGW